MGIKPSVVKLFMEVLITRNHCFTYSFWLRLASIPNPFKLLACYIHKRLFRKWGIQIPRTTKIGYGFYIGHRVGIVINPKTIIGNNVNLNQFLTICIMENVHIGNNTTIDAVAVVTKDVLDNTTVAGVPAKVLNYDNPRRFVNRWWNP